jgi:hypothetical protein
MDGVEGGHSREMADFSLNSTEDVSRTNHATSAQIEHSIGQITQTAIDWLCLQLSSVPGPRVIDVFVVCLRMHFFWPSLY